MKRGQVLSHTASSCPPRSGGLATSSPEAESSRRLDLDRSPPASAPWFSVAMAAAASYLVILSFLNAVFLVLLFGDTDD